MGTKGNLFSLSRNIFRDDEFGEPHWIWALPGDHFRFVIYLISRAAWKDTESIRAGSRVAILRGQILASYDSLATKTGLSRRTVRGLLDALEKREFLARQATHRFTILTLCNYEQYQLGGDDERHTDPPLNGTLNGTPTAQSPAPLEDSNNSTIEPNNSRSSEPTASEGHPPSGSKAKKPPPDKALNAAEYLRRKIVRSDPGSKLANTFSEHSHTSWAKTLDRLHRIDKQSWEDIRAAIDWLFDTENTFVVLSAESLRDKIDNIRKHMGKSKRPQAKGAPPPAHNPTGTGKTLAEWEAMVASESKA